MAFIRGGGRDKKTPIEEIKGHTARCYLVRSGDNFGVYAYYDGTLVGSKTVNQYGSASVTIKSDSSALTSGGFTLTANKSGISNDRLSASIVLNGTTLKSVSGNMYGSVDTGDFVIP